LGVRAGSDLTYDVSQRAGRFEAWAGIDPNASAGRSGRFRVYADRDLVFSVCEWGRERPWLWAPGFNAEMWRTTYDVTAMNEQTRSILLNRQVIAVNQDPLGVPGWRVKKMDQVEVWKRPLAGADIAVAFVNLDEKPRTIKVSWAQLNVLGPREVMDLWRHRSLGKHDSRLTFENIPSHGVVFVRLSK
ncbi:MAG: NPCBM/NEW2 domain-containing protein, partial [Phycisphaerae bacterium]